MIFESALDAKKFLNIYLRYKLYSIKDICRIMNVSESYFYENIAPNMEPIQLKGNVCNEIMSLIEQLDKSVVLDIKNLISKKTFYIEKNLVNFIMLKYKLDDKQIKEVEAAFLLQFDWLSLKDIKKKKDLLHDRQVYRFLESPESSYLKITTNDGHRSSMTRYIHL